MPYAFCEQIDKEIRDISDEIPFDIPESWEWVRLGYVCEIARGGSPRPIKQYLTEEPNGINWIKIGDSDKGGKYINSTKEKIKTEGVSKSRFVHTGDFLLTNSMSFGRPYILNVDGCIHDGWLVLSGYSGTYDKEFLFYMLSSKFSYYQFCEVVSGAVVKNLNSDKVADAVFPLPPLSEQHRIVAKIEELLPYIEKYEQAETKLSTLNANFPEALKKSILQEAVQGKLVPQNPDDEPASVLLERIRAEKQALIKAGKIKKDKHESVIVTRDKIPYEIINGKERCIADEVPFQIPESWCWCRLSDIVSFIGGYAYNSSDFIPQSNSQVLRLGNVKNDEIKLSAKPVFISDSIAEETALFRCLINDILITMTGTRKKRDYFFTVRIFSEEPPLYINQRVGCLRAFDSSMAHWLTWILKSETILSQVFQYETGTANQGNLGAENILKTMIPLPPLVEQHRIVSKIEGFIQHYEKL